MKNSYKLLAFVLLALLAWALRLWALERDPPPISLLRDEAPWTDEGTVALPAVNAVRGSTMGSTEVLLGGRALHRALLYGAFEAFGAGRFQGRVLSAMFGFVGLAALFALGKPIWPGPGSLLALTLGAVGFFFTMYDRLVLTEGVLVSMLTVTMLLGLRGRSQATGLLTGIGLGLLAFGFKLHALALFPALTLLYALRRRKLLLPFLAGFGMVVLLWRTAFIPRQTPGQVSYVRSRVEGDQMGLWDPVRALLNAWVIGWPAYYFQFQLPLLLFASAEILALLLSPFRWLRRSKDETLVALVWLVVALGGASAFRYQPARYFHIASPAVVLVALSGARRAWFGSPFPACSRTCRFGVTLVLGVPLTVQVAPPLPLFGEAARLVPFLGLPVPLLFYWLARRQEAGWGLKRGLRMGLVAALLLMHIGLQGGLWFLAVGRSEPNLRRAALSLHARLPSDAMLTGRLAASLALLAPLRAKTAWSMSHESLCSLAAEGSVWVLVLEGDENRVEGRSWADLSLEDTFPVDYSAESHLLRVYRFEDCPQ